MRVITKSKRRAEFGDFQTPVGLAEAVCRLLLASGVNPASIVEPTCGIGNFLLASVKAFPRSAHLVGVDINPQHIATANSKLEEFPHRQTVDLHCGDFFTSRWDRLVGLPEPILVVGNPPWVTNAQLGSLGSENLPAKSNFQNHAGFDAITGKSNFDISEWMLIHLLEQLEGKQATLAMLCKTAVARKTLSYAWKNEIGLQRSSVYRIDAAEQFGVAVDACLLVCEMGRQASHDCRLFASLTSKRPTHVFGYRDKQLVAEVGAYDAWKHLQGVERYRWRSGIKHDCSAVMELRRLGEVYTNGLGERVAIEPTFLYPMLKSSDVATGQTATTERRMLVPQATIAEDTRQIEAKAPMTWAYLQKHGRLLDRRGSSIYKKRPRFSVFGVGPYSFAPWKVAISGFYKSLNFRVVGPIDGKPTVFDDTCNFISCQSRDEAEFLVSLLDSPQATDLLKAFVFWDAKRPITVDVLRRIDLLKVAEALGVRPRAEEFIGESIAKTDALFTVGA